MIHKLLKIIYPLFWYLAGQIVKVAITYFVGVASLIFAIRFSLPVLFIIAGLCGLFLVYITLTTFFSVVAYILHLLFPKWNYPVEASTSKISTKSIFYGLPKVHTYDIHIKYLVGYLTGVKL